MQVKLLFPLCCLVAIQSFATIRTVSNSPSTIAQHSTIQAAIDASSSGDTIHVLGSPFNYAAFSLTDKKLAIIGPGFAPDKEIALLATVEAGSIIKGTGSSNSVIMGMRFFGFKIEGPFPTDLQFIRNYFDGGSFAPNPRLFRFSGDGVCKNYLFESNAFNSFQLFAESPGLENFLFRNNYFHFNTGFYGPGIFRRFTNCTNVVIDHNLFMGPAAGSLNIFSENGRFFTLSNNVFVHMDAAADNTGSYFNNNITFEAGDNTPWLSNGNVDGGGNLANTDPQMAAQAAANAGVFNLIADYSITAGPANNAGADGKDIGLLYDDTGPYNWAKARNNRLSRVTRMLLPNAVIQQGGSLEVNLKAVKAN
jgi:hypothetical protein